MKNILLATTAIMLQCTLASAQECRQVTAIPQLANNECVSFSFSDVRAARAVIDRWFSATNTPSFSLTSTQGGNQYWNDQLMLNGQNLYLSCHGNSDNDPVFCKVHLLR